MLCNLSYWALELHGSVATWPSLSCRALYEPSCLALLRLGYVAIWLFHLPSLGKARTILMRIYGELRRTTWFPKCSSFLINSGLSGSYFASKLL